MFFERNKQGRKENETVQITKDVIKAETCSKGSKIEISKKEKNVKRNLNPSLREKSQTIPLIDKGIKTLK